MKQRATFDRITAVVTSWTACTLLLLAGCGGSQTSGSIQKIAAGFGADSIRLGMTAAELKKAAGEPKYSDWRNVGQESVKELVDVETWGYDDFKVRLVEGRVTAIIIRETGTTRSGISIDDPLTKVEEKLGPPEAQGPQDPTISVRTHHYPSKGISFEHMSKRRHGKRQPRSVYRIFVYEPIEPRTDAIEPGVGVGPAKLGSSCKEAIAALGTPMYLGQPKGELYAYGFAPIEEMGLQVICDKFDKVVRFDLYPPFAGKSADGIGLDSPKDEAKKAIGYIGRSPSSQLEDKEGWIGTASGNQLTVIQVTKKPASKVPLTPLTDDEHQANVARAAKEANIVAGKSALGVRLGAKEDEIRTTLEAHPVKRATDLSKDLSPKTAKLHFAALEVLTVNDRAALLDVIRGGLTPEGVSVRTSEAQVVAALGEPDWRQNQYWYYDDGLRLTMFRGMVKAIGVFEPAEVPAYEIKPGVGVGPFLIGKPCDQVIRQVPPSYAQQLYKYHKRYRFGPATGSPLEIHCAPTGELSRVALSQPFAGKTAQGLGLDSSVEELTAAFGDDVGKGLRSQSHNTSQSGVLILLTAETKRVETLFVVGKR